MKVWGFTSFGEGIGFKFSNHFAPLSINLTAWKPQPQTIPCHPGIPFGPAHGERLATVGMGCGVAPSWCRLCRCSAGGGRAGVVGAGAKCFKNNPPNPAVPGSTGLGEGHP